MNLPNAAMLGAGLALCGTTASATPQDKTCGLLSVLGSNASVGVQAAIDDLTARWAPENRNAAGSSLDELTSQGFFDGGTGYRMVQFGDELEENLVLLRLRGGEVAAIRLVYEWTPEGPALTVLDFKRRYSDLSPAPYSASPQALDCS